MIGLLGIDYKTAPINIREKISFNSEQIAGFAKILKADNNFTGIVTLFTCNRSEMYFSTDEQDETAAYEFLLKALLQFKGIKEDLTPFLYYRTGEETYKHLFRVVSGLESMVLGEAQITFQVKEAYQISISLGLNDPVLSRMFEKALETGKKVRTQTKINNGAFSVSYAGIEKCSEIFPDLKDHSILLIGTGKTGELTLQYLVKKGCDKIYLANRTRQKAVALSKKYNAEVISFERLEEGIAKCNIIIVATASQKNIINKKLVEKALKTRNSLPYVFIDYSVPRNVDPSVGELENVFVFNVDLLKGVINRNNHKREKLLTSAEKIILESAAEFTDWFDARNLKPVINQIRNHFSKINKTELAGFKKINKAEENVLLDLYGRHIAEKYIRLLTKNLKDVTRNGCSKEYVEMLYKLFDLSRK